MMSDKETDEEINKIKELVNNFKEHERKAFQRDLDLTNLHNRKLRVTARNLLKEERGLMMKTYAQFKDWLQKKILETPTGELRESYTSVQIICGEFESDTTTSKKEGGGVMSKKPCDRLTANKKYRFLKDYYREVPPLKFEAKKGEVAIYEGKSLGFAHLKIIGETPRRIILDGKEAFKYLEEVD